MLDNARYDLVFLPVLPELLDVPRNKSFFFTKELSNGNQFLPEFHLNLMFHAILDLCCLSIQRKQK